MRRVAGISAALLVLAGLSGPLRASSASLDCFGEDIERRIEGCTALIERGDSSRGRPERIYAMRALAYSLKGHYATAIRDYDVAIGMRPDFAVALNNRAWAYFRWGKAATGLPDVEKSLQPEPVQLALARHPRATSARRWASRRRRCTTTTKAMWHGGRR